MCGATATWVLVMAYVFVRASEFEEFFGMAVVFSSILPTIIYFVVMAALGVAYLTASLHR